MKQNMGAVLALYPTPLVVVGTVVDGKPNWTLVGHLGIIGHDRVMVSMAAPHYSNKGIRENKALSINIVDEAMLKKADHVGCVSGNKEDKSQVFDYSIGEGGAPIIDEAPVAMACTVDDTYETPGFESFICKIAATYADESVLTEDGKINYHVLKPVLFEMPTYEYLKTGEVLGKCMSFGKDKQGYRGQPKGDVLHYLLNKRLGAEVDYIVKGVDQEHNVVAASRLEAMALKRREYYFRTDRDGNYQIYEGIRAEARVISVIRAGIFVDLFGAECYIPLRELSYQRWVDAAQHYQPGQRVLVRVLEVDRSDRSHPRVTASVKQAMENPYEKALKKYVVGNRYVGTVSMVDLNGVFVSLDGGIDCLCTYPKRGRPPRGARATVRILGINHENNRIWGVITHMSTTR